MTAFALQREIERIAADTRMPERLREIFAALDNDAFLIQECVARPVLVGRLARRFFERDEPLHGEALRAATELRDRLASGLVDPHAEHPWRRLRTLARSSTAANMDPAGASRSREIMLPPAEFEAEAERIGERVATVGPIMDREEEFAIEVPIRNDHGRIQVATFVVPKRAWDDWWQEVQGGLDELAALPVADADSAVPTPVSRAAGCDPGGSWDGRGLEDVPDPVVDHEAVWTGTQMLVWGGFSGVGTSSMAGARHRYDPATDTWSAMSLIGAPTTNAGTTALWTGSVMLLWGQPSDSGRYNPVLDSWQPISTSNAPAPSTLAVWTGTRMLAWGGYPTTSSGSYDPVNDLWSPIATSGQPDARLAPAVLWTGSEMIVWGGYRQPSLPVYLRSGGRYSPTSDSWSAMSMVDAPNGRENDVPVWTGTRMVIWGGTFRIGGPTLYLGSGSRYDPGTDSWEQVSSAGAPMARAFHSAIWSGSRMIIWGGRDGTSLFDTGGRYDPVGNTWEPMSLVNAPEARIQHTSVWTGSRMVVWGGLASTGSTTASGGRYDPSSDTWTPTGLNGAPTARIHHTAVWTGNEMIVWGGSPYYPFPSLGTGARFDPTLATWSPVSSTNAPPPREDHTAIWTGSEMIVWGGIDYGAVVPDLPYRQSGGRYDPIADTWTETRITTAPSGRTEHSAVWTGSDMIVWGGWDSTGTFNTGGRYDPVHNKWSQTSTNGAPAARANHAAIWTGSQMIVWGGGSSTGARYNPATNSWSSMAAAQYRWHIAHHGVDRQRDACMGRLRPAIQSGVRLVGPHRLDDLNARKRLQHGLVRP